MLTSVSKYACFQYVRPERQRPWCDHTLTNEPITDDDGYGTQHVGYGHACKQKDCAELPYPIPISEANAEKVLVKDLSVSDRDETSKRLYESNRLLSGCRGLRHLKRRS